ncbi:MAG: hypothetical protein M3140_05130 [Actinomycetota bacterium]|nr:hypothetical protein [Actinomycetota bacterium]
MNLSTIRPVATFREDDLPRAASRRGRRRARRVRRQRLVVVPPYGDARA